jgi:L-fucose isomerase-like protein
MQKIKGAFIGFGEVNSPLDIINKKQEEARRLLEKEGLELIYTAVVTDDYLGLDVKRAVEALKFKDFDFLIVCIAGWIPTHAVINVICEFKEKPMVLWGLSGYFEEGRLVTTADQAGTTALRKVMEDMGFRFKYVYNVPGKFNGVEKVVCFGKAACAVARLKNAKIGMMGYRDMNLYGTLFEGVSLKSKIGPEIEIFEMLEIIQMLDLFDESEKNKIIRDCISGKWQFTNDIDESVLKKGAGFYLAIRKKVLERNYQAISLIDVDGMKKLAKFPPAMIFMLLADNPGICTIPENDSLGAVTQLIVKYLTGQIAAYMEFYEFMEDRVLLGVPDFVPAQVVDGMVEAMFAGFGDISTGVLNISKVKTGRVTIFRLTSKGDTYAMHMATGTAVTPRKWEEAGWKQPAPQLPGLEIILDVPVEDFAQKVMSQHYIVTFGDNTAVMRDLCKLLEIATIE